MRRLVFESSLELMECTQCGTFTMKPGAGGARAGPPPFVKALLNKFSSGREEDKMVRAATALGFSSLCAVAFDASLTTFSY